MSDKKQKFYQAVGAYVVAEKIATKETTSAAGIVLMGSASPQLARAILVSCEVETAEGCNDRAAEALRRITTHLDEATEADTNLEIVYVAQHAMALEDDLIIIPVEAIVSVVIEEADLADEDENTEEES